MQHHPPPHAPPADTYPSGPAALLQQRSASPFRLGHGAGTAGGGRHAFRTALCAERRGVCVCVCVCRSPVVARRR